MTEQKSAKPPARLFHLDNLRIYLTILVILHHTAISYGGAGDWTIIDPSVDDISPIFLTLFTAVNQSYFMSAFFLLAGYFTPRSLDKKGPVNFIKDRLIRLGIPLLLYTTIFLNINEYLIVVGYLKRPFSLVWTYSPAHLWFLQALLILTVIYVIYRVLADRDPSRKMFQYYQDRFPPNTALISEHHHPDHPDLCGAVEVSGGKLGCRSPACQFCPLHLQLLRWHTSSAR